MEVEYINNFTKNKDIHDIYNIGSDSLPIYYNIYQLLELHKNPIYNIYKCVLNNSIIGFVIIEICSIDKIHIMSIAISKKYRGNGYGSQIIEFLKKKFENQTISLYVQTQNKHAVQFYFKHKFELKKYIENYYYELKYKSAYYCEYIPCSKI